MLYEPPGIAKERGFEYFINKLFHPFAERAIKMKNAIKTTEQKAELEDRLNQELIKKTVGVNDYEFALSLITSASNAIEPIRSQEGSVTTVMHSLRDLKPRDSMEAQLIGKSAVLFEYAMKSFERSGDASQLCHIEALTNLGIKLMRAHNETVETLNRYRRGGEQKITVNYALLANQAVVNNNYGEGGPLKNKGDTPCTQENAEQKQEPMEISHAETSQWPMEDADSTEEKAPELKQKKENNE